MAAREPSAAELEQQVDAIVGGLDPEKLLLGLGILAAALVLSWLARSLTRRLLSRHGTSLGVAFSLSKLLSYLLGSVGVIAALAAAGVDVTALLTASSALLIGLGFGLQTLVQNFVAGLVVLVERPVQRGDFVEVAKLEGTVVDVGLRASRILTRDGSTVVVPNFLLVSELVTNFSHPAQKQRVSVPLELAFDCDVDAVVRALLEVATTHEAVRDDPAPEVRLESFEPSGFRFDLRVWVDEPRDSRRTASELRLGVVEAFRQRGIPFSLPGLEVRLPASEPPSRAKG